MCSIIVSPALYCSSFSVSANAGVVANNTTATAGGGGALVTGKTVYTEVRAAQTSNGTGYLGAPASTTTATANTWNG